MVYVSYYSCCYYNLAELFGLMCVGNCDTRYARILSSGEFDGPSQRHAVGY